MEPNAKKKITLVKPEDVREFMPFPGEEDEEPLILRIYSAKWSRWWAQAKPDYRFTITPELTSVFSTLPSFNQFQFLYSYGEVNSW
jgi:hypothetical protein